MKQKWSLRVQENYGKLVFERRFEMELGEVQQLAADTAKTFTASHIVVVWPWPADAYGPEVARIAGSAPTGLDDLSRSARKLYEQVKQIAGGKGSDSRDVLIALDALAKDKATVAEVLGGAGAGAEFRREHISKRSVCRTCCQDGHYFDGIRDPYWAHNQLALSGRSPSGHVFEPNDARTRLVFERSGSRLHSPAAP